MKNENMNWILLIYDRYNRQLFRNMRYIFGVFNDTFLWTIKTPGITGLWTLSTVECSKETQAFRNWICFCPQMTRWLTPSLLGPLNNNKLHGLSPRANYSYRATAACRRSDCQLLRIEGATWSAWLIPRPYSRFSKQEPLRFYHVAPELYSRGWVDPVPDPLLFFL
jgi:hypothetical protein